MLYEISPWWPPSVLQLSSFGVEAFWVDTWNLPFHIRHGDWNTNRLQKIDIEYSIFTHRYGVLEFLEGCMAEHLSASL
ncbi:mCG148014 [Mus musculus]|jgi:hypothetical protein|nr:mCG148014 [Mus musculus]